MSADAQPTATRTAWPVRMLRGSLGDRWWLLKIALLVAVIAFLSERSEEWGEFHDPQLSDLMLAAHPDHPDSKRLAARFDGKDMVLYALEVRGGEDGHLYTRTPKGFRVHLTGPFRVVTGAPVTWVTDPTSVDGPVLCVDDPSLWSETPADSEIRLGDELLVRAAFTAKDFSFAVRALRPSTGSGRYRLAAFLVSFLVCALVFVRMVPHWRGGGPLRERRF